MLKIESSLDGVRQEWQIEIEKKLLRFDDMLSDRYLRLKSKIDDSQRNGHWYYLQKGHNKIYKNIKMEEEMPNEYLIDEILFYGILEPDS